MELKGLDTTQLVQLLRTKANQPPEDLGALISEAASRLELLTTAKAGETGQETATTIPSYASEIRVETPHGIIRAHRKKDAEYPGIGLFFIPNGKDASADAGPGIIMEYDPTYSGMDDGKYQEAQEKVVAWVYPKENPFDEPEACFEME